MMNATEDLIRYVDTLEANEAEKYAALLAACHTQRTFMLERGMRVERIESLHRQTVEDLAKEADDERKR